MGDYDKIAPLLLKENHLLGLSYIEGYIFFRVLNKELVKLYYDPGQEIGSTSNLLNIPSATFRAKQLFSSQSSSLNVNDLLAVSDDFHIYQVFVGIRPSAARLFIAPEGTDQRELDVGTWGTGSNYRFGYISGYDSPADEPTPQGEFFTPPDIGMQFALQNPLPYTISPTFNFIINRMEVAVIRDSSIIQKILAGIIPARLAPVGGLTPPKYNRVNTWKVQPITVDATVEEIQRKVAGKK